MNCKVIGIGAAGNKAAISLIENDVVTEKDVLLINSTLRDVPDNYRRIAIQFSNSVGGCGKERAVAKRLVAGSINDGTLDRLENFLEPDDNCIIVNSSEGGTGCGSAPTIAKYMKQVIGVNVHMFVFTGFEEDGRGLMNTIEYFKELDPSFAIQAISNNKFLVGNNKILAEKKANMEFVERVKILLGKGMIDSEQNIDETDLFKVTTTPGLMNIEHYELNERIKNVDQFNKIITDIIDNSKALESPDLSAKRLAVVMNLSEKSRDFVDYSFKLIKERYGTPYEVFTHIQYDAEQPEYINFIISGMNLPLDEVKKLYKKYQETSSSVNKNKDNFLSELKNMTGNETDSMFDMIGLTAPKKETTAQDKKKAFLNDYVDKWAAQMNGSSEFDMVNTNSNSLTNEEQQRKKEEFFANNY